MLLCMVRLNKDDLAQMNEAFVGWLITDGYGAYRHQKRRQRCLAHLIRDRYWDC